MTHTIMLPARAMSWKKRRSMSPRANEPGVVANSAETHAHKHHQSPRQTATPRRPWLPRVSG